MRETESKKPITNENIKMILFDGFDSHYYYTLSNSEGHFSFEERDDTIWWNDEGVTCLVFLKSEKYTADKFECKLY